MNLKRIICIIVMISILLTSLAPASFAATVYNFDKNNSAMSIKWKGENSPLSHSYYNTFDNYAYGTMNIKVSQDGIYEVSTLYGGNVKGDFCIFRLDSQNKYVPLAIATYGNSDEEITMDFNRFNSSLSKKASVYLEKGQEYYVAFMSESGKTIEKENPTESSTLTFYAKYIEKNSADDIVYETEVSSDEYTAPNGQRKDYQGISHPGNIRGAVVHRWLVTLNESGVGKALYHERYYDDPNIQNISLENTGVLNKAAKPYKDSSEASWFEKVITWFVVFISDAVRSVIIWAIGSDISIDKILFNEYPNTRLAIFDSHRDEDNLNGYLEDSGLLDNNDTGEEGIITKYFMLFRNLAIIVYIVMLLYMGVRILISSTGSKKEKYKSMVADWLKGIVILIFFPYIIKYIIVVNDAIVSYVSEVRNNGNIPSISAPSISGGVSLNAGALMNLANSGTPNGDIMETARYDAVNTGRLVYAFIYLFLIKQLVTFIYIYFKRLVSVIFLITIFPLVTVSYAVDKIGDGKSQAFNNWTKEFALSVFMQSFQAVNYLAIMSIIYALADGGGTANTIFLMVGFEYVSKGDELLRGFFSKMGGGGGNAVPKSLAEAAKTAITISAVKDVAKKITGSGRRVTNLINQVAGTKNANGVRQGGLIGYYDDYKQTVIDKYNEDQEKANQLDVTNPLNPISHVGNNIDSVLHHSNDYSPDEYKDILDNILIAKNSPGLRDRYDEVYANLSDEDKARLDELLQANTAINTFIEPEASANGVLTEMQINVNANIVTEILRHKYNGNYEMLYRYISSKRKDGNLLEDYLQKKVDSRTFSKRQQEQAEKVKSFFGNIVDIDTSKVATRRVDVKRHGNFESLSGDGERAFAQHLLDKYGQLSNSDVIMSKRKEAALLVARIKHYSDEIRSGATQGCSAEEGMELAKKWRQLSQEADTGVKAILEQLGDLKQIRINKAGTRKKERNRFKAEEYQIEADVGFTLEQFETMAALSVVKDSAHIGADKRERLMQDATEILYDTSKSRTGDKVSKHLISRSEIDDLFEYYEENGNRVSGYVRSTRTQEEIKHEKIKAERLRTIEKEYVKQKNKTTVSQARAKVIKQAAKTVTATASVAGGPLSAATGIATAAMVTGASGKMDLKNIVNYADLGMSVEHWVEGLIPGTKSATSNSNSFGNQIDKAIDKKIEEKLDDEYGKDLNVLVERQNRSDGARARINKYATRITRK